MDLLAARSAPERERARQMSVEVKSSEFEFSHGRSPRGFGTWAFQFSNEGASRSFPPKSATSPVFTPAMNFGEARRMAVQAARMFGFSVVWVCP